MARRGPSKVLTALEEKACQLYVSGMKPTEAMRQAGYSAHTVQKRGAYIFKRPRIKARIKKIFSELDTNDNNQKPAVEDTTISDALGVLRTLMISAKSEHVQLQAASYLIKLSQSGKIEEPTGPSTVGIRELYERIKDADTK